MDFPALIAGCPLITEAASVSLIGRSADCPSNRTSRRGHGALGRGTVYRKVWVFGAWRRNRALEADTILEGRKLRGNPTLGGGGFPNQASLHPHWSTVDRVFVRPTCISAVTSPLLK
jgi:hypothetical protein